MSRQFYEAKKIYSEYVHFKGFINFDEWNDLPEDYKAAYLYVEFYKEIQLAWDKIYKGCTPEEDGLEAVTTVLLKNVPIISDDSKRYTPSYIYTICYRRLVNLCSANSRPKEMKRAEIEVSNMFTPSDFVHFLHRSIPDDSKDGRADAFDYIQSADGEDPCFKESIYDELMLLLSCFDKEVCDVAVHLMCGKKLSSLYSVSTQRKSEIVELLSTLLYPYKDYYCA